MIMDYFWNPALPGKKIFSLKKSAHSPKKSFERGSTELPNKIWQKSLVKGFMSYDRIYKQTETQITSLYL